jgi:hypothetical protein
MLAVWQRTLQKGLDEIRRSPHNALFDRHAVCLPTQTFIKVWTKFSARRVWSVGSNTHGVQKIQEDGTKFGLISLPKQHQHRP